MKKISLRAIFYKITGGRPMTCECAAFYDSIGGINVYRWEDKFGRRWLAQGAWSIFRVRLSDRINVVKGNVVQIDVPGKTTKYFPLD